MLEIGRVEPIRGYDESYLSIRTPDVRYLVLYPNRNLPSGFHHYFARLHQQAENDSGVAGQVFDAVSARE